MKCKSCKREIPDNSIFCNWCGARQLKQKGEIKIPKARQLPSGTWYMQLRKEGQSQSFNTEAEANAWAKAVRAGFVEQHGKVKKVTIGKAVDEYIKKRESTASPATIDGYKRKRKNNFQSLMNMTSAISDETMQKAIDEEMKEYSGKTIKNAYTLICAATGRKWDVKLPSSAPKKKPPVFSSEDIKKFLAAIEGKGEIECAALLAMWLSLRRSEILALKWEDVGENTVTVRAALVYDENHKLVEKATKTIKSHRTIPCPKYILDKLNALPHNGDRVFTRSTSYLWESLNTICKNAGLQHMYIHGLRHTNASIMALLKIPDRYAMKRGGWSTDSTMKNVYQEIMDEGEQAAAKEIDAYFLTLANAQFTHEITDAPKSP